jgi:hypothetical protein
MLFLPKKNKSKKIPKIHKYPKIIKAVKKRLRKSKNVKKIYI